jgi:hypothetical protein
VDQAALDRGLGFGRGLAHFLRCFRRLARACLFFLRDLVLRLAMR